MSYVVLVGQGPGQQPMTPEAFVTSAQAGHVPWGTPVSVDNGQTYVPAEIMFQRIQARGDDAVAFLVPTRVETFSTLGQYLGLFSLLFFGGPFCALAPIVAFEPGPTKLFRLGAVLAAMVVGPAPIGLLGFLGLRALRKDPTQRGKGRAIFALVVAGLMLLPCLIALPGVLLR